MTMYLVVTVDVEEDNWGAFNLAQYSTKNIEKIPQLQNLFDKYNVIPSYLLSYPVATDKSSISIFSDILRVGKCEIGTHPHPWNTPPIEEEINERNSMLCNLPGDLQFKKIRTLHEKIQENFNSNPIIFRSGRWGFNEKVAENILSFGYKIDTSITPYTNWRNIHGPNFENCHPEPYRFDINNIFETSLGGHILEIPPTIGFLQSNLKYCVKLNNIINQKYYNKLKMRTFLNKLGMLNRIRLSPEVTNSQTMIKLTEILKKSGQKVINMFFHSPSLLSGCSPYSKTDGDERKLLKTIDVYLEYCRSRGIEPVPLKRLLNMIR